MNTRQVEQLYDEIITIWPNPMPAANEAEQWARHLVEEAQLVAERTLTYLEQEMVQGNPRRFRPALTEWVHRYKLLDKARQAPSSLIPHACVSGMIEVAEPNKTSQGMYRPCEHCNPEGYERWRNAEYRLKIDRPEAEVSDPRVGFGWLDKIRTDRGLPPKEREIMSVSPSIDLTEEF